MISAIERELPDRVKFIQHWWGYESGLTRKYLHGAYMVTSGDVSKELGWLRDIAAIKDCEVE